MWELVEDRSAGVPSPVGSAERCPQDGSFHAPCLCDAGGLRWLPRGFGVAGALAHRPSSADASVAVRRGTPARSRRAFRKVVVGVAIVAAARARCRVLIYRKFKNSFPGALRPESGMVGRGTVTGAAIPALWCLRGRYAQGCGRSHPAGGVKSLEAEGFGDRRKRSRARAANQFRSAMAGGQLVASSGAIGDLGPGRTDGTRRDQRIRWPSRSMSGSTPKHFCIDVAQRSRRGFPSRSCPRSANTASCVWHFTRGARSPKYRMLWR